MYKSLAESAKVYAHLQAKCPNYTGLNSPKLLIYIYRKQGFLLVYFRNDKVIMFEQERQKFGERRIREIDSRQSSKKADRDRDDIK